MFPSFDEKKVFLKRTKDEREDRPKFTLPNEDLDETAMAESFNISFYPKLDPNESKRQMYQRRIKKVILTLLPTLPKDEVGIEKGRGEVWIRRSLVATVPSEGDGWVIQDAISKYGIAAQKVTEAVHAELQTS